MRRIHLRPLIPAACFAAAAYRPLCEATARVTAQPRMRLTIKDGERQNCQMGFYARMYHVDRKARDKGPIRLTDWEGINTGGMTVRA